MSPAFRKATSFALLSITVLALQSLCLAEAADLPLAADVRCSIERMPGRDDHHHVVSDTWFRIFRGGKEVNRFRVGLAGVISDLRDGTKTKLLAGPSHKYNHADRVIQEVFWAGGITSSNPSTNGKNSTLPSLYPQLNVNLAGSDENDHTSPTEAPVAHASDCSIGTYALAHWQFVPEIDHTISSFFPTYTEYKVVGNGAIKVRHVTLLGRLTLNQACVDDANQCAGNPAYRANVRSAGGVTSGDFAELPDFDMASWIPIHGLGYYTTDLKSAGLNAGLSKLMAEEFVPVPGNEFYAVFNSGKAGKASRGLGFAYNSAGPVCVNGASAQPCQATGQSWFYDVVINAQGFHGMHFAYPGRAVVGTVIDKTYIIAPFGKKKPIPELAAELRELAASIEPPTIYYPGSARDAAMSDITTHLYSVLNSPPTTSSDNLGDLTQFLP